MNQKFMMGTNRYLTKNEAMKPVLYQICFQSDQFDQIKSPMICYDNTKNPYPDLREYYSFNKIMEDNEAPELYGMFGPRYEHKLRYSAKTIYQFIESNLDSKGVYIFNFPIVLSAFFLNVWEHGEYHHPGISRIAQYSLKITGYDENVINQIMTKQHYCFSNYFVTTRAIWKEYLDFVNKIIVTFNDLPEELANIYHSSANYSRDFTLNYFVFIFERLFSTYLKLNENSNKFNVYTRPYDYSLIKNDKNFINVMNKLLFYKESSIKGIEEYNRWNSFRHEILKVYPSYFYLEA